MAHRVPAPARRRARRRRRPGRRRRRDSRRAGRRGRGAGRRGPPHRVGRPPPSGVETLTRATALAYFDGMVPVWQGDTLHQIRARAHVFATGSIEQPLVFAGNDLPGVMLSGGARRLLERYAVSPGTRAVIATTSDRGLDAAARLHDAGVRSPRWRTCARPRPRRRARSASAESSCSRATPSSRPRAARRSRARRSRRSAGTTTTKARPSNAISSSCRAASRRRPRCSRRPGRARRTTTRAGCFTLADTPEGVFAAGEVAGYEDSEPAARSGRLAGLAAAGAPDRRTTKTSRTRPPRARSPRRSPALPAASASPASART